MRAAKLSKTPALPPHKTPPLGGEDQLPRNQVTRALVRADCAVNAPVLHGTRHLRDRCDRRRRPRVSKRHPFWLGAADMPKSTAEYG